MAEDMQDLIDSIQGRLDTEQEVLDGIKKQEMIHQDRVKRLRTSLRALKQEPEAKPQKKRKNEHGTSGSKPSPQMIQAVLTVIAEADEPLTLKEIEERSGRSHSAADYTVRYLRDQEMIRLAGKRGTAFRYGPWKNTTALKEADNGVAQLDAV